MEDEAGSQAELEALRQAIDGLNLEFLDLLSRRGQLVQRIGRLSASGAAPEGQDPAREEAMLQDLLRRNPGPYPEEALADLFRTLLKHSLALKLQAAREHAP